MYCFSENPLKNREDLKRVATSMLDSLWLKTSPQGAGFNLGPNRAFYGEAPTRLETFSRMLWVAAPLCSRGELDMEPIARGLAEGTNPQSPAFWGWAGVFDQRFVEMTAIAFTLKIAPSILDYLSQAEKQRLADWLDQINKGYINPSNWLFFRVFVNQVLDDLGGNSNPEKVEEDLSTIEALYIGDGWYGDGGVGTIDYYNSFAFHFYSLLYAQWTGERNPERAQRFREQAVAFSKTFIYWWDTNGSSIPYGRSLVYRFGMAAFWVAAAYTDLPVYDHGVLKGILLRHLRWWFDHPIFDATGILNLGFTYPNHNMVEMYNAPGSPMWGLKAFLPLALPDGHPFWTATEAVMPVLKSKPIPLPDGKKVLGRGSSGHAWMLSAGHNMPWQGRAFHDKYARFAYSSVFGFSVSLEGSCPGAMAPDSSLIISVDGRRWFGRRETEDYRSGCDWVESTWVPFPGVRIVTRLTITADGHRRRHEVHTQHAIDTIEGGYAVPRPAEALEHLERNPVEGFYRACRTGSAEVCIGELYSKIYDIKKAHRREGSLLQPWANTHLLFPTTLIPVLQGRIPPGVHYLECEVSADRL